MKSSIKSTLIRFLAIAAIAIALPIIWYQFQSDDPIEAIQTLGYIVGAIAIAIRPAAFVQISSDPKVTMAEVSKSQKILFVAAIFLVTIPFLAWYVGGFGEII